MHKAASKAAFQEPGRLLAAVRAKLQLPSRGARDTQPLLAALGRPSAAEYAAAIVQFAKLPAAERQDIKCAPQTALSKIWSLGEEAFSWRRYITCTPYTALSYTESLSE